MTCGLGWGGGGGVELYYSDEIIWKLHKPWKIQKTRFSKQQQVPHLCCLQSINRINISHSKRWVRLLLLFLLWAVALVVFQKAPSLSLQPLPEGDEVVSSSTAATKGSTASLFYWTGIASWHVMAWKYNDCAIFNWFFYKKLPA